MFKNQPSTEYRKHHLDGNIAIWKKQTKNFAIFTNTPKKMARFLETTKWEAYVRLGRLHRTSEGGEPAELETSAEAPSSFRLTPRIGLLALGMSGLHAQVHC